MEHLRRVALTKRKKKPLIPRYVQKRVQQSLVYLVVLLLFLSFGASVYRGGVQLAGLEASRLTIHDLPYALVLSLLRMTVSYVACVFVSYFFGLLAARTELGERLIIPVTNILQSVPVVGFFPAAVAFFVALSGGTRMGIEMAAVFLIFTSQAWNMVFAVYESTKTIPQDTEDAVSAFGISGALRFWKLYGPASVPRLIYNSILSWTNGWYFLVACEIITVGQIRYDLPGIGTFLARAAEQNRINLVFWGLFALTALILLLDFLIWRPAMAWAERFRADTTGGSGVATEEEYDELDFIPQLILQRFGPIRTASKKLILALAAPFIWVAREILLPIFWDLPAAIIESAAERIQTQARAMPEPRRRKINQFTGWIIGVGLGVGSAIILMRLLSPPWPEVVRQIPKATLLSTLRLVIATALSIAWTIPVVYLCYDKPKLRKWLGTIAQIGASLPAIALFPLIVLVTVRRLGGGMEEASIILLMTGMQWYLLFNGLGGSVIVPPELTEAGKSLGLSRYQIWKHIVFPGMKPALVTGLVTAFGGGWNALVVSEYVVYQGKTLEVNGLGALLSRSILEHGDTRSATICITALMAWTVLINAVLWQPMYTHVSERYRMDL